MAATKVPRVQLLKEEDMCPFHRECCESWDIPNIQLDLCAREKDKTVYECPQLKFERGVPVAFETIAA